MNAFKIDPWLQKILHEEKLLKFIVSPEVPLKKKKETLNEMSVSEIEKAVLYLTELLDVTAEEYAAKTQDTVSLHIDHSPVLNRRSSEEPIKF